MSCAGRIVLGTCALWLLAPVYAQHAELRQGNVYYVDAEGHARQITSAGIDRDASLSFDGKSITFVKDTARPVECMEVMNATPNETQIWLAKAVGSSWALQLILRAPLTLDGVCYVTFRAPKLGPDNRVAYFVVQYAVTEGAVVVLEIGTKEAKYVTHALDFDVVGKGKYKGDLVVLQRTPVDGGFARLYWLVDPRGRELGFIGWSRDDVDRFLADPRPVVGRGPVFP